MAAASPRRPTFAADFPADPELDALVDAFARGNYARVRAEASALAQRTESDEVRRGAELLRSRIEPDPIAKAMLLFTLALLVALTGWWLTHQGAPLPSEKPQIEYVK